MLNQRPELVTITEGQQVFISSCCLIGLIVGGYQVDPQRGLIAVIAVPTICAVLGYTCATMVVVLWSRPKPRLFVFACAALATAFVLLRV